VFSNKELDFTTAKKNVNRQATKILHDIASAYATGAFDDPTSAAMFCSLLACICEGKVQGSLDDDGSTVLWSLTNSYEKELANLREAAMEFGLASGRVVEGPWK